MRPFSTAVDLADESTRCDLLFLQLSKHIVVDSQTTAPRQICDQTQVLVSLTWLTAVHCMCLKILPRQIVVNGGYFVLGQQALWVTWQKLQANSCSTPQPTLSRDSNRPITQTHGCLSFSGRRNVPHLSCCVKRLANTTIRSVQDSINRWRLSLLANALLTCTRTEHSRAAAELPEEKSNPNSNEQGVLKLSEQCTTPLFSKVCLYSACKDEREKKREGRNGCQRQANSRHKHI